MELDIIKIFLLQKILLLNNAQLPVICNAHYLII